MPPWVRLARKAAISSTSCGRPGQGERIDETADTVTFHFELVDGNLRKGFRYLPGQFGEISAFGQGESTFVIAGDPARPERLTVTTKRVGAHTEALHHLYAGAVIDFRGPYGKPFPVDEWKGKDIVIAGGGIGLAPLKPIICHVLNHRADYGKLTIVYGARSLSDLMYAADREIWGKAPNTELVVTVDKGDAHWKGREGFVAAIRNKCLVGPPPDPNGGTGAVLWAGRQAMVRRLGNKMGGITP